MRVNTWFGILKLMGKEQIKDEDDGDDDDDVPWKLMESGKIEGENIVYEQGPL